MVNYYDVDTNRRRFVTHLKEFDSDQLYEINSGNLFGLTTDQMMLYVDPRFNYLSMRLIKECLTSHMDIEKVKFIANPEFNYYTMDLIRDAFNRGLSLDHVKEFVKPGVDYKTMLEMKNKLISEM